MEGVAKKLSPAVYVLALICFFLPFVTFSCQAQKILTLSGIQLVTGTTIQQPQPFGPPKAQKVDAEPLAVLAFLSGIAGLALSFLRGRKSAIAPATAGVVAAILLLALKSKLDGDALRQGGGVIQVDYAAGFWAVLILFLAAVAVNVFFLVQGKGLLPPTPKASGDKFCAQCGSRNLSTDVFCRECGAGLVPVAPEAPSAALMATKLTRCPACGADLAPGKKFCGECGAKFELAHAAPPFAVGVTSNEKKAPAPAGMIVAVAALLTVVTFLIWYGVTHRADIEVVAPLRGEQGVVDLGHGKDGWLYEVDARLVESLAPERPEDAIKDILRSRLQKPVSVISITPVRNENNVILGYKVLIIR